MGDSFSLTFKKILPFMFEDVPKLLWALPLLIKNILEALVNFGRNILRAFEVFIRSIFTFIGDLMKLNGDLFKTFFAFLKIF